MLNTPMVDLAWWEMLLVAAAMFGTFGVLAWVTWWARYPKTACNDYLCGRWFRRCPSCGYRRGIHGRRR
jgi:hypothetical protein